MMRMMMLVMTQCAAPDLEVPSAYLVTGRDRRLRTGNWKLKTLNSRHETLLAAVLVVWAVCSATTKPKPGAKTPAIGTAKWALKWRRQFPAPSPSRTQVQQDDQVNFETGGPNRGVVINGGLQLGGVCGDEPNW